MTDTIIIIAQALITTTLAIILINKDEKINELKYQKERKEIELEEKEELISYYENKYQDNEPSNFKIIMENGKEINLQKVVNVNQVREIFLGIRYDNGKLMYVNKNKIQQIDVKEV